MEYEAFKKEVKNRIKSYLPEEFQSWKVKERKVYKVNETLEAFHLMPPEGAGKKGIYPTFYFREYYELLQENLTAGQILRLIASQISEYTRPVQEVPAGMEPERYRDDIICVVINQKGNEDLLRTVPHRKFLNLAVIYRVHVYGPDGRWAGLVVNRDYMKSLGMTLEELHEQAMAHTLNILPPKLTDLNQKYGPVMICQDFHDGRTELETFSLGHEPPLFLLSNEPCDFGAAMMLYTDVLDMAAEFLGGNFYILPGSIHELYLVPEEPENLSLYRETVLTANQELSSIRDWLSDDIYLYDFKKHRLTLLQDEADA